MPDPMVPCGTVRSATARFPIVAVGLTTAAFICIRSARDAAFFSPTGLEQLPPLYLITQIGLALAATVHVGAMKRFGTRKTRMGAFLLVTGLFAAASPFVNREHSQLMAVLFPLVPIVFAALFSSAWLLAGDLLEGEQPDVIKKAYLRIGASGLAGGTTGGLVARFIGDLRGPEETVMAGAIMLALATMACHRGHRARPADPPAPGTPKPSAPAPLEQIFRDPRTRTIAIVAALGTASGVLVEFQFYASATAAGTTDTTFFANWSLITSGAAIFLQLALAPLLQSRFGLAGALMVLPATLFFGAGSLVLLTAVLAPSLVRLGEIAIRASVHQTSWEQLFLVFAREERGPMKVLLDGVVARLSGVISAVGLWGLVLAVGAAGLGDASRLGAVLLLTALAWIAFTRKLATGAPPAEVDPMIRLPDS